MSVFVVFILMIFAHIVDDYYLQGVLATMKQKSWWEKNFTDEKYKNDYIVALIMHATSWSIMIILPVLYSKDFWLEWWEYLIIGANIAIHSVTDDLKANKKKINLIQDQAIHIVQITVTWAICCFA